MWIASFIICSRNINICWSTLQVLSVLPNGLSIPRSCCELFCKQFFLFFLCQSLEQKSWLWSTMQGLFLALCYYSDPCIQVVFWYSQVSDKAINVPPNSVLSCMISYWLFFNVAILIKLSLSGYLILLPYLLIPFKAFGDAHIISSGRFSKREISSNYSTLLSITNVPENLQRQRKCSMWPLKVLE